MAAKRMTQSQIVKTLAEKTEVSKKAVQQFLEHLAATAIGEVKRNGLFVLPGLGRLVRTGKRAWGETRRPARRSTFPPRRWSNSAWRKPRRMRSFRQKRRRLQPRRQQPRLPQTQI